MEINFTSAFLVSRKSLSKTIMRTFIFLFCTVMFGFSPNPGFSQNAKVQIKSDVTLSVDQVFELIQTQTDYNFIYSEDLFKNTRKVNLKKGTVKVSKLLESSLFPGNFVYEFTSDMTIVLSHKVVEPTKEYSIGVEKTVSGVVKDRNGDKLPGVTVVEKGTNNGVSAGYLGDYEITVANNNSILIYSFVGYQTKEVVVGDQTEINVVLIESVMELETVQIISTGYQKISQEKLTGAAANVDQSFYENLNKPTLQEGLQGSVAGMQVASNNSHPQSVPQVIIRGVGSAFQEGVNVVGFGSPKSVLGAPATLTPGGPLYVIDGIPTFDGRDMSSINPNDIESISVLKDAAAASIYGARAANGVIVVETKSGKSGRTVVTYSAQYGISNFAELSKSLNTKELQEIYTEGLINNTSNGIDNEADALEFLLNPGGSTTPFNPDQNTDWGEELTRQSQIIQHNLSVSGSKGDNRYYLSIGSLKNGTAVEAVDFNRTSVKLKYDTKISERVYVTTNVGYGKTKSDNYDSGTSYYSPFRNIYRMRPDLNIHNDDGSYDTTYNFGVNPLGILTDERREIETDDFRGAIDLTVEIIDNFTFETNLSGNYQFTENYNNFPDHLGKGLNNRSSYAIQKNYNTLIWNARALLRYNVQLNESHNLNVFGGIESSEDVTKITNVSVDNMRAGSETLDNGSTVDTYTSQFESAISSLFLNADYTFQDKYLVNASYRRDGSSRFGSNKRFGNFYAIGLGWNMHEEDFMKNTTFVKSLKLRSSYGVNGNDQIGSFNYVGTFKGTSFYNGENVSTILSAGNASLGWEQNATFDIGVDFSLFDYRLSGVFDYYNRNTSDLLYNLPVSAYNGDNYVFQNFGGMRNSGIEISLSSRNIVSNDNGFEWNTAINYTSNKNKITELNEDEILSSNYIRKVGEDFNTLNIYGYAGVDKETGNELYYTDETETETTSSIGEAVKYNHGKTTPDFYGSFNNTFLYKNFSFTAQFYMSWGGQIFETAGYIQHENGNAGLRDYSNTSRYVYENRWQQPGDVTNVPKYVYNNARSSNRSARWLHDASYVRLKKIELAYDFPFEILEKTFINNLRVYVNADNVWTYVKDDTLINDPEMGGITGGASFNAPLAKSFYFGLNVSF